MAEKLRKVFDNKGESLLYVLGVMMFLVLICFSVTAAAVTSMRNVTLQKQYSDAMIMDYSIHKNIMYSLQADPNSGLAREFSRAIRDGAAFTTSGGETPLIINIAGTDIDTMDPDSKIEIMVLFDGNPVFFPDYDNSDTAEWEAERTMIRCRRGTVCLESIDDCNTDSGSCYAVCITHVCSDPCFDGCIHLVCTPLCAPCTVHTHVCNADDPPPIGCEFVQDTRPDAGHDVNCPGSPVCNLYDLLEVSESIMEEWYFLAHGVPRTQSIFATMVIIVRIETGDGRTIVSRASYDFVGAQLSNCLERHGECPRASGVVNCIGGAGGRSLKTPGELSETPCGGPCPTPAVLLCCMSRTNPKGGTLDFIEGREGTWRLSSYEIDAT
jgi:hypothetical protein